MRGQGPRRGVIFSGIFSGCIGYVGSDWLDYRLERWIYHYTTLLYCPLVGHDDTGYLHQILFRSQDVAE